MMDISTRRGQGVWGDNGNEEGFPSYVSPLLGAVGRDTEEGVEEVDLRIMETFNEKSVRMMDGEWELKPMRMWDRAGMDGMDRWFLENDSKRDGVGSMDWDTNWMMLAGEELAFQNKYGWEVDENGMVRYGCFEKLKSFDK